MKTARFSPVVLAVAAVVACLAASAVANPDVALVPPSGDVTEGTDTSADICVSLVSGGPLGAELTVAFSLGGSAIEFDDFEFKVGDDASVVFPVSSADGTVACVAVDLIDDDVLEYSPEYFSVSIINGGDDDTGAAYSVSGNTYEYYYIHDDETYTVEFTTAATVVQQLYSSTSVPVCFEISTDASGGVDEELDLRVTFDFDGDADVTNWWSSYADDVYIASSSYYVSSINEAGTHCVWVNIQGFKIYNFIDDPNEPDETITVSFDRVSGWDDSDTSLRNPIGAVSEMTITILSYRGPVVVGFAVSEQVVTEGDDINACVRLFSAPHGVTEPIPLYLFSEDFDLGVGGVFDFSFPIGAMPGDEVCATVSTLDDDVASPTREGYIHLNHGSGDTDSSAFTVILHNAYHTVAVVDNDVVEITITDLGANPSVAEGSSINIGYTITVPAGGIDEFSEMYFYFGSDFDSDTADLYNDFWVGGAYVAPGPHDTAGDRYLAYINSLDSTFSKIISVSADDDDEAKEEFKIDFSVPFLDNSEGCYDCERRIGADTPTARVADVPRFPIVLVNADPVIISIPGNRVGLRWTDASRNLVVSESDTTFDVCMEIYDIPAGGVTTDAVVTNFGIDDAGPGVKEEHIVSMDESLSFPAGSAVGFEACSTVIINMANDAADGLARWLNFEVYFESSYYASPDSSINVIFHDDEVVGVSMVDEVVYVDEPYGYVGDEDGSAYTYESVCAEITSLPAGGVTDNDMFVLFVVTDETADNGYWYSNDDFTVLIPTARDLDECMYMDADDYHDEFCCFFFDLACPPDCGDEVPSEFECYEAIEGSHAGCCCAYDVHCDEFPGDDGGDDEGLDDGGCPPAPPSSECDEYIGYHDGCCCEYGLACELDGDGCPPAPPSFECEDYIGYHDGCCCQYGLACGEGGGGECPPAPTLGDCLFYDDEYIADDGCCCEYGLACGGGEDGIRFGLHAQVDRHTSVYVMPVMTSGGPLAVGDKACIHLSVFNTGNFDPDETFTVTIGHRLHDFEDIYLEGGGKEGRLAGPEVPDPWVPAMPEISVGLNTTVVTIGPVPELEAICSDITVAVDDAPVVIAATDVDGGSYGGAVSIPETTVGCAEVGSDVSITLTVADDAASEVCSATVSVVDNTAPIATCVTDLPIVLDAITGAATIAAEDLDNGSTDNCDEGPLSFGAAQTAFDCADLSSEDSSVMLYVTDASGNSAACAAPVTVVDAHGPVLDCEVPVVAIDVTASATVTADDIVVGAADNCDVIASMAIVGGDPVYGCGDVGAEVTLVVEATDGSGNMGSCSVTFTVVDATAPGALVYEDSDGDNWGNPLASAPLSVACPAFDSFSYNNKDCDDTTGDVTNAKVYFVDADGDGYGAPGTSVMACPGDAGISTNDDDCDDGDATFQSYVHFVDNDGDGFGSTETVTSCQAEPGMFESDTDDDCNDLAIHINPGAADSICDGVNNDCTGVADDDDADGDGLTDCQERTGFVIPGVAGVVVTDIYDADSDEDGFDDPVEVSLGTHPHNAASNPCSVATCGQCINADTGASDLTCGWCSGLGCTINDDDAEEACAWFGDLRFLWTTAETATGCGAEATRDQGVCYGFAVESELTPSDEADVDLGNTLCASHDFGEDGACCSADLSGALGDALASMEEVIGGAGDCCYDAVSEVLCGLFCSANNLDWLGLSTFGATLGDALGDGGDSLSPTLYAAPLVCNRLLDACGDRTPEPLSTGARMCAYLAEAVSGALEYPLIDAVRIVTGSPYDVTKRVSNLGGGVKVTYSDALLGVFVETEADGARVLPAAYGVAPEVECAETTVAPQVGNNVGALEGEGEGGNVLGASTAGAGVAFLVMVIIGILAAVLVLGAVLWFAFGGRKDNKNDDETRAAPAVVDSKSASRTQSRFVTDADLEAGGYEMETTSLTSSTLASSTADASSTAASSTDDQSGSGSFTSSSSTTSS